MLVATFNDADGIILTTARGISSVEDFDTYMPILMNYMNKSVAKHGQWLHIVDASENLVQPKDATAHVSNRWNDRPREDGYTAYITGSILAKMQIERMRDNPRKGFFPDAASARTWLLSQVAASSAAAH